MGKPLQSLHERHLVACRLKVEGRSASEIAAELGVKREQVYQWMCDPLVKQEISRLRADIHNLFVERMSDLGMRALAKMEELADLELEEGTRLTVSQRLEILQDILDRHPATRKAQPGQAGGSATINLNQYGEPPPDMTDAELIEMAKSTAAELPAIEGTARDGNGD